MVIDRLRMFIEDNGIDIAEAAAAADMTEHDMKDALAGKTPMPLENLLSFCKHFNLPIGKFMEPHMDL